MWLCMFAYEATNLVVFLRASACWYSCVSGWQGKEEALLCHQCLPVQQVFRFGHPWNPLPAVVADQEVRASNAAICSVPSGVSSGTDPVQPGGTHASRLVLRPADAMQLRGCVCARAGVRGVRQALPRGLLHY